MDLIKDRKYFYLAVEGLKSKLPSEWQVYKTRNGDLFYYNT